MMKKLFVLIIPFLIITLSSCEKKQEKFNFSEEQNSFFREFNWDLNNQEIIKVEKIKNNISVIFGYGGNILVSIGSDGTLIIDSQFPQLNEGILKEIQKLGGSNIDYIINTHWHFDHAEGNRAYGPMGSTIIAHENSRDYMKRDNLIDLVFIKYPQQAYDGTSLPTITYKDSMNLNFNDNKISLYNFGPAHTTGDTIIYFEQDNIIHFGDILNIENFVFIDSGNGGSLSGMINNLEQGLKLMNKETIVVPGHGEITNYDTVKKYLEALIITKEKLLDMIDMNMSVEEIIQNNPIENLEEILGNTTVLINRSYLSLIKSKNIQ